MVKTVLGKVGFVLANMFVMVILHGNSKQFWPKIPYLSLKDESTGEHARLLFNTLGVVTVFQALIGRLPRERWLARGVVLAAMPAALPLIIFFGQKVLRLQGHASEVYNLSMVPILPIAAMVAEDAIAKRG
ncbi:hypothetical protein OSCT_1948 [Oscillochloris trichoides DG-6]|uniref:Uncharacterized protein n=1 Tax=Oscillochloris trichoides DG-6 TaxID=765420 RepID=E1IF47_9CHLR|nr:hypothetical protein [Oscillochloris trichoides]EFO80188.1 hypothetical protein OSCT_1948 [Oscillochloris trichoides DG-6]